MAFTGQLRSNAIFAALYNMIISQQVFGDNIKGTFAELVDAARVDGTLYGDTKLYYSTDVLKSAPWGNDAEATNLLQLHRPAAPKVQAIYLDVFRQISLTVDDYLSKQAFSTEGAFSQFNSVMMGWIKDTKRVYDSTLYNTYIGTTSSLKDEETITVTEASYPSLGQGIGEVMADLFINLQDVSRNFNDDGLLRSYSMDEIRVVWNAKYVNQIKKIDMPVLFHKEGLIEKFEDAVLPARYFGLINNINKQTADAATRSLGEIDVEVGGEITHVFPGDLIPTGAELVSGGKIVIPSYQEDDTIICKVMCKDSVPFMSAFEVGTSFFNPKALTENHYLTFGHNTLQYLTCKPMITVNKE